MTRDDDGDSPTHRAIDHAGGQPMESGPAMDQQIRGLLHARAARLSAEGSPRAAIETYLLIQRRDPLDLRAIGALRDLYMRVGNPREVAGQWLRLSDYRARKGTLAEAARALGRAEQIDPYPETAEAAGDRWLALGAVERAAVAYLRAAATRERQGREAETGRIRQKQARLVPALEDRLRKLCQRLETQPGNVELLRCLARAYVALGRLAEAGRVWWRMGEAWEAFGSDFKAMAAFSKASVYDHELIPHAHLSRAEILQRIGLAAEAERECERAFGPAPVSTPILH